jgi:Phage major capsid protein E
MPMNNPFSGPGYGLAALTVAINKLPNMFTLLGDMALFTEEGTTLRTVIVEQRNNVLNLLSTRPLGSPGTQGTIGKREIRSFVIPHIPHDDVILPAEVQGVRAFGTESETDSVANLMALKLQTMKNKHAITKEWLRVGALNGIVYDADGVTVLYNYFTEFGITPKVINFQTSVATNEMLPLILSVKRWIETHLFGETSTGVMFLCSPQFFDAFTTQATVKDAYKYYQTMQGLSGDYRKSFTHGGCMFAEYNGQATDSAGNVRRFIADNEAIAFPLGTTQTFKLWNAPADFNETANTVGLPLYAKQEERDFERGWDLHTQSNPLPICTRPEVLVRITKS